MTVLFKRHFQIAYLVDDIRAGMDEFAAKHGVSNWHLMDMAALYGEGSPTNAIALAWTDADLMVELIEPNPAVESIYSNWRPDLGAGARLHHLGFKPETDAEFDAIIAQLGAGGCPVSTEGTAGDALRYAYIDTTRALGHYYELILLKGEGGKAYFAPVPQN
ncbi:VOC family protein [Novosphingobium sp. ERN07]|uniref:VOC family protein n=1 Tax=Novosphingobium sp. ERN07 TaxID=2726187 RepID=UPI001456B923|nr:VOC family protein [Novosphingobium sp. ERN07]NLR72812.1 VOC family protein [Novosphingobium sp. ERN07]